MKHLIKNVQTLQGARIDLEVSGLERGVDGSHLLALPALIDPHVHFRVPGAEYKEDWKSGSAAALRGGITTVFDMPNNTPPCVTCSRLDAKKGIIDGQLAEEGISLRYGLYLGADRDHLQEITHAKSRACGLKIFMGCSTGHMVLDDPDALARAFKLAAEQRLVVAVHAEDQKMLEEKMREFPGRRVVADHSRLRPPEAACAAVKHALSLAETYGTRLYILHVSTAGELALIAEAKARGVDVFAEATPHHLFFTEEDYAQWGTWVQMNPPLRTKRDQEALWEALRTGVIDTLGTDHAPHALEEKQRPFGEAPSGVPGVEVLLPLMLDAVSRGKLSLERLTELTRWNIEKIFGLASHDDLVLVDVNLEREVRVHEMVGKSRWSPYEGRRLRGWPRYTILKGKAYEL